MNYSQIPAIDADAIKEALADHPTAANKFAAMVNHELAATAQGNKRGRAIPVSLQRQRENVQPLVAVVRGEGE